MSEKSTNQLLSGGVKAGLIGGLVGGAAVGSLATLGVLKVVSAVRTLAAERAARSAAKAAAAAAEKQRKQVEAAAVMSQRLNRTFKWLGLKLRAEKAPAAASATAPPRNGQSS